MALKEMYAAVHNSVPTQLVNAVTATATSFAVEDGSVLPDAPNVLTISVEDTAELVWYGAKDDGAVSSCVRGFGGTQAQIWPETTPVYRAYTAVDHQGFIDNIEDLDARKLDAGGNASAATVAFAEAQARANVESGEGLGTLFGKLRKWFASFGAAAWLNTGTSSTTVAKGNHTHTAAAVGALAKPTGAASGNLAMFDASREAVDSGKPATDVFSQLQILAFVRDALYPVGSIYLSVSATSPATLMGGSWARIAQGRTLVGLSEGDADFGAARKAAGVKEVTLTTAQMPSHGHVINYSVDNGATWTAASQFGRGPGAHTGVDSYMGLEASIQPYAAFQARMAANGGGAAHSNLQPYYTVYIWERTA